MRSHRLVSIAMAAAILLGCTSTLLDSKGPLPIPEEASQGSDIATRESDKPSQGSGNASPDPQNDPQDPGGTTALEFRPENAVLYGLPKGYVSLTIERKFEKNKPPRLTVTMAEPEFVADANHIYLLKYLANPLSSDKVTIKVNERGLLTAITTSSKDSLPAAVREFADFVIGVRTSGITAPTTQSLEKDTADDVGRGPFKVEAVFNPARDESKCKAAEDCKKCDRPALKALKAYLRRYRVTIDVDRPPIIESASVDKKVNCAEMICYRFVLPYHIVVSDPDVSGIRVEALTVLPNEGPIAGISIVRRSFVENKFELTFSNGVLTKAEYEDPSALVGALRIPIDMAKAIVSIPSALFRFTVARETDIAEFKAEQERIKAESELLAQQKQLIQSQLNLLKAKQELEDAQGAP